MSVNMAFVLKMSAFLFCIPLVGNAADINVGDNSSTGNGGNNIVVGNGSNIDGGGGSFQVKKNVVSKTAVSWDAEGGVGVSAGVSVGW